VSAARPCRRDVAAWTLLLGACVSPLAEEHVATALVQQRLPAITAGSTPVAVLEQAFGPATATFEQGRLRCWALMLVERGLAIAVDARGVMRPTPAIDRSSGAARSARRAALAVDGALRAVAPADHAVRALWPVWREVEHHLTVVVDEEGRVARWSFVRVLP
jgi:hypothetical protein